MHVPRVSVVVATRDRPDRLAAQLACLGAQTMRDHEVIVVDDGSDPPASGGDVTVRREEPGGPAAARNAGWRAARAPLVAFTDDDCEAAPEWLAELLAAWGEREDVFVQGATAPIARELGRGGPYAYSIEIDGPTSECETCNIAYPRALLECLGGFDEALRTGEDMDLALRARRSGARPVFAPRARVEHAVMVLGPRRMLARAWSWSTAMRPLADSAELRAERLVGRVFWNWSHYLVLRAAAGAPFARRRWGWPIAWWLAGPLLRFEVLRARRAGAVRSAPFWLAHDLTEMGACIRGSARYGTLVI